MRCVRLLLLVMVTTQLGVVGQASGADTAISAVLAKAGKQPLTATELGRVIRAFDDVKQSGLWSRAAEAMVTNWERCKPAEAASGLYSRWGSTPERLSELGLDQLASLFGALRVFRRGDLADDAWRGWVSAGAQWKRLAPAELRRLARLEKDNRSPQVTATLEQLAEHAWPAYLGKIATFEKQRRWDCIYLTCELGTYLSAPRKAALAGVLDKMYAEKGGALAGLSLLEMNVLGCSLARLGRRDRAVEKTAAWMATGDAWRKDASPRELTHLGYSFTSYGGSSKRVDVQKGKLASHLWERYLGTEAGLSRLSTRELLHMVMCVDRLLSSGQQRRLARNVIRHFTKSPEAAAKATVTDIMQATRRSLGRIATPRERREFVRAWMVARNWRNAGSGEIGKLTEMFAKSPPSDVKTLVDLANLMRDAGAVAKGVGLTDYAGALAQVFGRSPVVESPSYYDQLAVPLRTPGARSVLARQLVDGEGMVRQGVARVLACAYWLYVSRDAFGQEIDKRLAGDLKGDRRAGWLLARAYVEAIRPGEYSLRAGRKWIDQALVASESEEMKLRCLEALVMAYADKAQAKAATSLLASVRGQFRSPRSLAELDALAARAGVRADAVAESRRAHRARTEKLAGERHASELRRRLGAARARKDVAAVRRYERLLRQRGVK